MESLGCARGRTTHGQEGFFPSRGLGCCSLPPLRVAPGGPLALASPSPPKASAAPTAAKLAFLSSKLVPDGPSSLDSRVSGATAPGSGHLGAPRGHWGRGGTWGGGGNWGHGGAWGHRGDTGHGAVSVAPCESALHFVKSREVRQNIMGSLSLGPGFRTGQVSSTHPWRCAGLYTDGRPVCPSSIAPGTVGLEVMVQGGPGSRTLDLCALDAKAGQLRTGGLGPAPQSARRWPPTQPPSGCLLVSRGEFTSVR